jgi:hypothetical protein
MRPYMTRWDLMRPYNALCSSSTGNNTTVGNIILRIVMVLSKLIDKATNWNESMNLRSPILKLMNFWQLVGVASIFGFPNLWSIYFQGDIVSSKGISYKTTLSSTSFRMDWQGEQKRAWRKARRKAKFPVRAPSPGPLAGLPSGSCPGFRSIRLEVLGTFKDIYFR